MALKINNYWRKRRALEAQTLEDTAEIKISEQIAKEYVRMAEDVSRDIERLYLKIQSEHDEVLVSHLYQYNRYYELLNEITEKLTEMGISETKILGNGLMALYEANCKRLNNQFGLTSSLDEAAARKAIEKIWAPDKENWEQRISKHQARLYNKLSNTIVDGVARGVSTDTLTANVMNDFGMEFNEAHRLVSTECSYIMNQSTYDKFEEAGITEYEFFTYHDTARKEQRKAEVQAKLQQMRAKAKSIEDAEKRLKAFERADTYEKRNATAEVCPDCEDLDGQRFKLSEAVVGENYPPIHPNCRCTVLAVLDEER